MDNPNPRTPTRPPIPFRTTAATPPVTLRGALSLHFALLLVTLIVFLSSTTASNLAKSLPATLPVPGSYAHESSINLAKTTQAKHNKADIAQLPVGTNPFRTRNQLILHTEQSHFLPCQPQIQRFKPISSLLQPARAGATGKFPGGIAVSVPGVATRPCGIQADSAPRQTAVDRASAIARSAADGRPAPAPCLLASEASPTETDHASAGAHGPRDCSESPETRGRLPGWKWS